MAKRSTAAPKKDVTEQDVTANWPDYALPFLEAFTGLGTIRAACKKAGVSSSTVYRLRERDPAFAEEWAAREEASTDELEEAALKRAKDGSDVLLIFLLKSRRPDVYRDRLSIDDDRQEAARRRLDRATEDELDDQLKGVSDNVVPIRKAG